MNLSSPLNYTMIFVCRLTIFYLIFPLRDSVCIYEHYIISNICDVVLHTSVSLSIVIIKRSVVE